MNKFPKISIIIANYNGGKVFENTLKSLGKISYPNWELIVVDNGSGDGSTNICLDPKYKILNVKLIKNKYNLGFAPANNQGYKVSKGKYILLLNNDTLVEKNFLNVMVEKMEKESDIGAMQPKIKMMDDPRYLDNAGSFLTRIGFLHHWGFMRKDSKEFSKEKNIFAAKGACLFIKREVIEKVGLFDDGFMSYFEESDFCWKTWLLGYRVIFYPATFIRHKVGFTIKRMDVTNMNFHYYKNRITSLIKNLGTFKLLTVLPLHLLISFGISFVFLTRGQIKSSFLIWKAIFWNLTHLRDILIKRKEIQNIRKLDDKYIFDKLSVPINWVSFFNDFKRVEKDMKKK